VHLRDVWLVCGCAIGQPWSLLQDLPVQSIPMILRWYLGRWRCQRALVASGESSPSASSRLGRLAPRTHDQMKRSSERSSVCRALGGRPGQLRDTLNPAQLSFAPYSWEHSLRFKGSDATLVQSRGCLTAPVFTSARACGHQAPFYRWKSGQESRRAREQREIVQKITKA
jgi:hypothetical protein